MFGTKQFVSPHFDLAQFVESGAGINVFTLGNQTIHDQITESTIAIVDNLNARNTCNLTLKQTNGKRPLIGQELEIRTSICPNELQKTIFKGTVDRISERNEYLGANSKAI